MIKKLFIACALGIAVLCSNCATTQNAPNLTPAQINQYNLTTLVNAIGTLQTAAENAVPTNILKFNTARLIVQFTVGANTAIAASPNGWKATVGASYTYTKSQLTVDELNKFSIYLAAFETVLNSF